MAFALGSDIALDFCDTGSTRSLHGSGTVLSTLNPAGITDQAGYYNESYPRGNIL